MAAVPEEFEQDFEQAYRAHYPLLHRRSRRFFPAEEAEDAVQETFLRAWTHHRGKNPGIPWMMTVLRNLAIDRSRRKHAEPVGDIEQLDRPTEETTADQVISLEERRALHRAMEGLTPAQQEALKLREWHGLSHKEVAERLGTTVGGVESLLIRGKRRLRSALEGAMALLLWPASSLWRRLRHLPTGSTEVAAAHATPAVSGITVTVAQLATAAAVLVASVASGPGGGGPDGTSRDPIGSYGAITVNGTPTHDSRMLGTSGGSTTTSGDTPSGSAAFMPGGTGGGGTTTSQPKDTGGTGITSGSEGGAAVDPAPGDNTSPESPKVEPTDPEQGEVPNQDPPNSGEMGEVPEPVLLDPGIGAMAPTTSG